MGNCQHNTAISKEEDLRRKKARNTGGKNRLPESERLKVVTCNLPLELIKQMKELIKQGYAPSFAELVHMILFAGITPFLASLNELEKKTGILSMPGPKPLAGRLPEDFWEDEKSNNEPLKKGEK